MGVWHQFSRLGQRAYSIRTRIKTQRPIMLYVLPMESQRAYSIRTRIKTTRQNAQCRIATRVREHIPLEQGLRQSKWFEVFGRFDSQRAYSIRTRIKTRLSCYCCCCFAVREHIPLEQGLRRYTSIPLRYLRVRQRAYSIRTRIKTLAFFAMAAFLTASESIFH